MIKFLKKNEAFLVLVTLIIISCQIFFSEYFNILDGFSKNKNNIVYTITFQKHYDNYILRLLKDYSTEYIDKVAPSVPDIDELIEKIEDGSYIAFDRNNLHGEFYGVFDDDKLESLHAEVDFAIGLDDYFKNISQIYPGVESIQYASRNDFVYKWPKSSSSELSYKYAKQSTTSSQYPNDSSFDTSYDFIKFEVNIFDENNNYYGVITYTIDPKVLYAPLDEGYYCIVIDDNNKLIYTNIPTQDFTPRNVNIIESVFTSKSNISNDSNILVMDNKYYYIYTFDDGTQLLQFIDLSQVIIDALKSTVPLLFMIISYIIFLIFKKKYTQMTQKLNLAISDLDERYDILKEIAMTDFLTNVNNRNGFDSKIKNIIGNYENISLAITDIDKFKRINDRYGHEIGDVVIKEFASFLVDNIGPKDIIARWGGEEFVIAFAGRTEEEAYEILESIRKNISVLPFYTRESENFNISASFGVAQYNNIDNDFDKTVVLADEALYYSKSNGRNSVTKYSSLNLK